MVHQTAIYPPMASLISSPTTQLETSLSATMRALAGEYAGNLSLSLQGSHTPSPLHLQHHWFLPTPQSETDTALLRGVSDRLALAQHHHNPAIYTRLAPSGAEAREVYDALEILRVELHGARHMEGVLHNLHNEWVTQCEAEAAIPRSTPPMAGILRAMLMQRVANLPIPDPLASLVARWQAEIEQAAGAALQELMQQTDNQEAYAQVARTVISCLSTLNGAGITDIPNASANAAENNTASMMESMGGQEQSGADTSFAEQEAAMSPSADSGYATIAIEQGGDILEQMVEGLLDGDETEELPPRPEPVLPPSPPAYSVFSTEHDEIIMADKLVSAEELQRLRGELDKKLANVHGTFAKLSNQLQRLLLAKQRRRWTFEEEEGLLDSARLARLVASPHLRHIFKQEHETEFKDTVVTLLLDNSGSMRGRPITIAALTCDILAKVLERAGVKVEILGFTTKEWKGGSHGKAWVAAGKPPHAGRLNDLRHIIYKPADMPFIRAKRNLGLMLKDGLLKENIDGEALAWAYSRLKHRPEARRILMVISDGAPVDDATLSANHPAYLDKHLRHMIAAIEADASVELTAIGIGHDVTRYYARSICLNDVTRLGETMTKELTRLFA
jgi:cobaltochelatase CobT